MRAVQAAFYMPRHAKVLEIQASLYRKTRSPFEPNICIQLFQESLSEKVHATIPKGIVGGFEFNVLQRNLKEWHKRPWTCLRLLKEATKVGSTDYTARNRVLIISYITFQDCRVQIFFRHAFNSCKQRCLAGVMPHKSNTRNNRQCLSLNFGDVTWKPRIA